MTDPDVIDLRAFRGLRRQRSVTLIVDDPSTAGFERLNLNRWYDDRIDALRYAYNALVSYGVIRCPPSIIDASKF